MLQGGKKPEITAEFSGSNLPTPDVEWPDNLAHLLISGLPNK